MLFVKDFFYLYLCDLCDLLCKNLRPPDEREIPTEGRKDHKDPMQWGYRWIDAKGDTRNSKVRKRDRSDLRDHFIESMFGIEV